MNSSERIVMHIPVDMTPEEMAVLCKIQPDSPAFETAEEALPLIKQYGTPRAILRWVPVDSVEGDVTIINGVSFRSKVVAEKLKGLHRVFLFIATVGNGLEQCPELEDDPFLEMYNGALLRYANLRINSYLKENFGFDGSSRLNPGSLPDWPIENNFALFDLVGDPGEIGVELNEKGYIKPWNSNSGICFPGEGYQNCSLCKNYDCIGRRAKFDRAEYVRIFGVEP